MLLVVLSINTVLCIYRYPVVSMGVLRWLEHLALEPSFFKVASDSYVVYLILLDEVLLLEGVGLVYNTQSPTDRQPSQTTTPSDSKPPDSLV